jgi:hypothetical protein
MSSFIIVATVTTAKIIIIILLRSQNLFFACDGEYHFWIFFVCFIVLVREMCQISLKKLLMTTNVPSLA